MLIDINRFCSMGEELKEIQIEVHILLLEIKFWSGMKLLFS